MNRRSFSSVSGFSETSTMGGFVLLSPCGWGRVNISWKKGDEAASMHRCTRKSTVPERNTRSASGELKRSEDMTRGSITDTGERRGKSWECSTGGQWTFKYGGTA